MRLDRINEIEKYIIEKETVSLYDLSEHFHVSINTIRRDLNELIKRGNIFKTYGGVSANTEKTALPMSIRAAKNSGSKQKIGCMAANLVQNGDTIFIDSGSTAMCIIPHLSTKTQITIVTHSLDAMYEAAKYPNLQVIALGGIYNRTTSSYVGITTLDALSGIALSTIFIAATGVTLEHGLTNTTFFEAEIKRKVVHSGGRVILMADHSKFGYNSTISFFDFKDLAGVVTDQIPPSEYMEVIRQNKILLLCEENMKAANKTVE